MRIRAMFAIMVAGLASIAHDARAQFALVDHVPQDVEALPEFVRAGGVARIDWEQLDHVLDTAPMEGVGVIGSRIELPMPEGVLKPYRIVQSPIMEEGLSEKYPSFRTYRVFGDDGSIGRIDVTSQGLRSMIRVSGDAPARTVYIDPYSAQQREFVSVYDMRTLRMTRPAPDWSCHVGPEHGAGQPFDAQLGEQLDGGFAEGPGVGLRAYRMAMACTGEFGAFHSLLQGRAPNQGDALAAIVTIVNRATLVFELDLGVRFLLVANNDLLAFFDPATDPYPDADPACTADPAANCSGAYHSVNQGIINGIIGSANYDVGHVVTRVRGGVATLRSVCGSSKARGVSGIPRGGEADPLSAWVVTHELGHQFGANHTYNGLLGRCGPNVNGGTAWEPGGGSTIMAYPGACPVGGPYGTGTTDNLVQYGDDYFHSGSLLEMRSFLNGPNSQCHTTQANTNLLPVITSITPSGKSIPPLTPFELSCVISDDSPAPLYCWDQLDLGPQQSLVGGGALDNGLSPLFRSFPPVLSPARTFPRMQDVLTGVPSLGEQMPSFPNSVRKFRVSVRDGQGGSITSPVVQVNVTGGAPFSVTAPAAGARFVPNGPLALAWDVAATDLAPFNASTVWVFLATGSDANFSQYLGELPNTGSGVVTLPSGIETDEARVKLVPTNDNIFFAVSRQFTISQCDSLDFNGDGLFPDTQDVDDFLNVFGGGACSTGACADIDFNNDGLYLDTADVDALLRVFAGGPCL